MDTRCWGSVLLLYYYYTLLLPGLLAHECIPCEQRRCPKKMVMGSCEAGRHPTREPCGCCWRCSRLESEPCGGEGWAAGYCGRGLRCLRLNGTGLVKAAEIGVCQVVPSMEDTEDGNCGEMTGCSIQAGSCRCETRRTCIYDFQYSDYESCLKGKEQESPRCVHDGKEYADGDVYRMDTCWYCRCRSGISFCSKAECAEVECERYYIPDGECCPICQDSTVILSRISGKSCWVNGKMRIHEEQWKEDDCTFCRCVDGDPHCTAMACKQTCQNPVKIPGECCPFCEEPTYGTVSPILCPRLENCFLSEKDCPFGFVQDRNGCLLCQCLTNDSCPNLPSHCSLDCPNGFRIDDYGCKVCDCFLQIQKCRPLSCNKACQYGYVRNKHGCAMCRCVKCPPFSCDKDCPMGYAQNRRGCSLCQCKEATTPVLTTVTPAVIRHCLTPDGRRYEEGESWHDGCRDCYCHAGKEMCVLITCPVPNCLYPIVRPQQCCPTCEDESGSGHPDVVDLAVCKALGGEYYIEGEVWRLDPCTQCTCRSGRVLCDSEICPPVLCQMPTKSPDACCPVCPDDQLKALLPVNSSRSEYCLSSEGEILLAGESWKLNPCTSCACNNGTIRCFSQSCPSAPCRVPVLRKGQCCPYCPGTSTVLPRTESTTSPQERSTVSAKELPLTLASSPEPVPNTEGTRVLAESPQQMEMVVIYQSAVWVLAGILLAIILFLIAAFIANRKKHCMQMSCSSAPKKTKFFKNSINKQSLHYMEPAKECKLQNISRDCRINLTPQPCSQAGERCRVQVEKKLGKVDCLDKSRSKPFEG
ncbi:cysteine-rich motor neuron 1 protein-like isoform X2 [Latimeria chalumnae]|uniref:cysteine-rich motor neuron 1 protein-like isoform X2 n=1 Tax=Latimeria chalumnae TaxID=7897 RepID=UPI00313CDFF0